MDHNLLNILLGRLGSEGTALSLDDLSVPFAYLTSKLSSSASFILRVEMFDFGVRRPETLHWSSAPLVICLDDSLCAARSALILLGRLATCPPAGAARAWSKKRTCTTTLSGSNSFCAACVQASADNFLQSRTRHMRFLSLLLSSGCP